MSVLPYDSWGKLISIDGTLKDTVGVKNPYRYRSYRYDTETGLYYLQSRYYNPEWGRFINADDTSILMLSQGKLMGANLFSYCDNNPVNNADPSGYFLSTIIGGISGAGFGWLQAKLTGGNTKVAALCGAISGIIAGFGVDYTIATYGTGIGVSLIAGTAGALISQIVYYWRTVKGFSIKLFATAKNNS